MAVKIRLKRMGNRNRPFFRMVAIDQRKGTSGRYIENLGWYNPLAEGLNFRLKLDRVEYWQSVGAQSSDSAASIIKKARKYQPADGEATPEPEVEAPKEEAVKEEAPKAEEKPAKEEKADDKKEAASDDK